MTYLATEMLLYLASAAIIGLALGWLFWGAGQRRRLSALRTDLMAKIEAGREAHKTTKLELEQAGIDATNAVKSVKAELQQSIDSERLARKQAETELEHVRAGVDEAIREARTSSQDELEKAMQVVNTEKAIAAEAMAKESRSRAQIEELRLLIGAEKLAAESARAELEKTRSDMQSKLETERAAHSQAKIALDDIRFTLAKTFGAEVLDIAGRGGNVDAPSTLTGAPADGYQTLSSTEGNRDRTAFAVMTDMTAAGDALNNPDRDEADIEDREDLSLDLPSTLEAEEDAATDDQAASLTDMPGSGPVDVPESGKIELAPVPEMPAALERPLSFSGKVPDEVDDLQAIDGIGPDLERSLNDSGCYHYRQIANLTTKEVEWLAQTVGVSGQQIDQEQWIEQARSLEAGASPEESMIESLDQRNATG